MDRPRDRGGPFAKAIAVMTAIVIYATIGPIVFLMFLFAGHDKKHSTLEDEG